MRIESCFAKKEKFKSSNGGAELKNKRSLSTVSLENRKGATIKLRTKQMHTSIADRWNVCAQEKPMQTKSNIKDDFLGHRPVTLEAEGRIRPETVQEHFACRNSDNAHSKRSKTAARKTDRLNEHRNSGISGCEKKFSQSYTSVTTC